MITTMPFNEVRLVARQPATVNVGTLRIYYAFESGGSCADIRTALLSTQAAPDNGSLVAARTGEVGGALTCLGQDLTGTANVVNGVLTDYATYVPPTVGLLNCRGEISVANNGTDYPAGTFAGFVISKEGGLLNLSLLDGVTINLYRNNNATPVATMTGSGLLSLGLLNGNNGFTTVGFKSAVAFDEIQIVFNSGLLAVNTGDRYRIYYAYVIKDTDNDQVPDVAEVCGNGSDDSIDSDGDGTPDACDNCSIVGKKSIYADTDGDGVKDACDADSDDDK